MVAVSCTELSFGDYTVLWVWLLPLRYRSQEFDTYKSLHKRRSSIGEQSVDTNQTLLDYIK